MKLFPVHWANQTVEFEVTQVPVGQICTFCQDFFRKGQHGVTLPYSGGPEDPLEAHAHRGCFRRSITGASEEDGERAGGDVVCICGNPYRDHPLDHTILSYDGEPFLHIVCDGRQVKL